MNDPLIALFDPLLGPLTERKGLNAACAAIAKLLNAAALDALCGHSANGDRLIETIGGQDAPPALRRQLMAMVAGRRRMWPEDRRILRSWSIEDVPGGVSLRTECEDLDDERAARLLVSLLIEVPPASMKELRARLLGVPRAAVRDALARSLSGDELRDEVLDVICASFDVIDGPGRQLHRLTDLAAEELAPLARREAAWRVIVSCPEQELQSALDRLDPITQQELTALGTAAMLRRLVSHPDGAAGLGSHLGKLEPLTRRELVIGLEEIRALERIPASALYGPLLRERSFPELDSILVPALVSAGGPGAEHALAVALAAETDPERARLLRRGLLDVRTARIEPANTPDHVRAWLGVCDGRGAFPVLLATHNDRLRYRLATVVVHCDGHLRDGSVIHDLDVAGLDEVVKGYERLSGLTDVPPSTAAAFVAEALEGTDFSAYPASLQQAADEVMAHHRHDVGPPDVPTGAPSGLQELRSLYLRPTLQTWFLDGADLRACDIPVPPVDAAAAIGWSRTQAPRVTAPRVRNRLASMALHFARWSSLDGDRTAAALGAAALDDLEQGGTTFLRAVLEHTAFTALEVHDTTEAPLRFGHEATREQARLDLSPSPPRGRDLAALDLVDLLVTSGRDLCGCHVDASTLRPDERRVALTAAAVGLSLSLAEGREQDLREVLQANLAEHGVPPTAVEPLANAILDTTTRFLRDVCQECSVQCWSQPDAAVGRDWEGPGHPGLSPVLV